MPIGNLLFFYEKTVHQATYTLVTDHFVLGGKRGGGVGNGFYRKNIIMLPTADAIVCQLVARRFQNGFI